jgi:hypothetical protein
MKGSGLEIRAQLPHLRSFPTVYVSFSELATDKGTGVLKAVVLLRHNAGHCETGRVCLKLVLRI